MNTPYCELLFGGVENCQRLLVARVTDARLMQNKSCEWIDELLKLRPDKPDTKFLPSWHLVEADPSLLTGLSFYRVMVPLRLNHDTIMEPELSSALNDPAKSSQIIRNSLLAGKTFGAVTNQERCYLHILIIDRIIFELNQAVTPVQIAA